MPVDEALFLAVQSLTGVPLIDQLMVFLAEVLVVLVPLSLIYLWFQGREAREDSIFAFETAVLGLALSYIAGMLYFHENPSATFDTIASFHAENSFPSQHTTVLFATGLPLIYRERKTLGGLLVSAGVLTGFARVFIGEHWPVDIFGAFLVSVLALGLTYSSWSTHRQVWGIFLDFFEDVEGKLLEKVNQ